jgi:hypothetical protein
VYSLSAADALRAIPINIKSGQLILRNSYLVEKQVKLQLEQEENLKIIETFCTA